MAVLGTVGISDRGIYNAGTTYRLGNFVLYQGSSWLATRDNLIGVTPANGADWKYLARGFQSESLSGIDADDISGVLGSAGATVNSQILIDAIADRIMTKLIAKTQIVSNLTTAATGSVLDASQGKVLQDAKLNISNVANNLTTTASGYALDARQGTNIGKLKANVIFTGNKVINTSDAWNSSYSFANFDLVQFTILVQGFTHTFLAETGLTDKSYCVSFGYYYTADSRTREWLLQLTTGGRYLSNVAGYMSYNKEAFAANTSAIFVTKIVGYNYI